MLKPLASLKLTVVLLALAMLLVYAGTWAQVDAGVWQVQKKYFHSLFTWVSLQTLLPRPAGGAAAGIPWYIGFPLPGGYLLGAVLLVNLLAAHALRFKATWKDLLLIPALAASFAIAFAVPPRDTPTLLFILLVAPLPLIALVAPLHGKRAGVILIHLGLILLVVGEGITSTMAVESQMTINEGGSANYSQDIRTAELAIIDASSPDHDRVAAIPASRLAPGTTIADDRLPVRVQVDAYFANSSVLGPMQSPPTDGPRATAGAGVGITAVARPPVSGAGADGALVDAPSAYVTLKAGGGQSVGTFLVSTLPVELPGRAGLDAAQDFTLGDKTYRVQLRFRRLYKPYTVHLIDFRHDTYLGTSTPKDYSSFVRLVDPARNVDREVRIWMNNPLRYHGETFYQASFIGAHTTVLQVVTNPGWVLPYLACAIGAFGLVIHFMLVLIRFMEKRAAPNGAAAGAAPPAPTGPGWLSGATLGACASILLVYALALASVLRPVGPKSDFDLRAFGNLPVSYEGRVQPLDTLARTSLKIIGGREVAMVKDGKLAPTAWLIEMFSHPKEAAEHPVIRIDHPELLGLLKLDESRKRFSFKEVLAGREKLEEQVARARRTPAKERDLFQRKVLELYDKLHTYMTLAQMEDLFLIPPLAPGEKWQTLGQAMPNPSNPSAAHPAARAYLGIISAYHDRDASAFNSAVAGYRATVSDKLPRETRRARFEWMFNRLDPFTQCMALYVGAFVLVCLSWTFAGSAALRRAALLGLGLALAIHTLALIGRVYISGRPPVTNLPSSAIFIAWGGVVLALGLERFYRDGIGAAAAAVTGFLSLLIADRLALSGDTLKVLQAVLDTNFWLATHVVIITLGYSATFLAGILAIVYVIQGVFTRSLDREASKDLTRMIYGITCFAVLFSFVGTVLGGIWADQSWGRFWGWDPKENGAVLIVLCNALLLHARWGGMVKERGIACLAIFGNIVTSWSWFGTNMLGVGLHSYGFMDSALAWLLIFVLSQVALIVAANVPLTWWRSHASLAAPAPAMPIGPRRSFPSPI
ncbi:MAG TPA: cytochrome c biogenesis protein CcsA [Tepidisphaeraceae bacterium]|nr:cytochrome c biogenesis protein CcsA [Tepidisphaeraceae bacterium]